MAFGMSSYTNSLTGAFREVVSLPSLEGAAGIVTGILAGDMVGNFAVQAAKTTTTGLTLLVKGVAKFAVAGLSIFLTSRTSGGVRVIGTTAALGSVASFVVDLLAASPFAKQLGLAAVKAFQINVPFGRRTAPVIVQSATSGLKSYSQARP